MIGAYALAVEWTRALAMRNSGFVVPALILGGAALAAAAAGWTPAQLGLGTSRLGFRLLGGFALGAVLLLPSAVRSGVTPLLPASLALAAVAVSVGEEIAFRGALYAALDDIGRAPLAIVGSTLVWTLAHALSHPPAFLGAVAAAGLLLALWRWAARDLVGPVVAHVIADLAL
ncbi:MAG TPA: CPBP family intramembrane glutamic endopeptidase [Candidatus Dormibacteraeota bacterium]|nr:CPBP family intramembrane glutamic endopeptidase [Candidatus Dormibacteraeota bacterium]